MASSAEIVSHFHAVLQERLNRVPASAPEVRQEANAVLASLPEQTGVRQSKKAGGQTLPVVAWFEAALSGAQAGPEATIASAISPLAADLTWTFGYPPDPRWPTLGSSAGFADIIGKAGLLPADVVVGLTLLAPGTYYPLHAHPAVELYLVLSGNAEWTAGPITAVRPPGSLILHPTQVPHAMRTHDEPLLALFTWRGDIASPSVFVE